MNRFTHTDVLSKYLKVYNEVLTTKITLGRLRSVGHTPAFEKLEDEIKKYEMALTKFNNQLEQLQLKHQDQIDLQYWVEQQNRKYKHYMYHYYVYTTKKNNGPNVYVAENSSSGRKIEFLTKDGLVLYFAEKYGYLRPQFTFNEMVNFVEARFRYV